jgi:hypothetical protein
MWILQRSITALRRKVCIHESMYSLCIYVVCVCFFARCRKKLFRNQIKTLKEKQKKVYMLHCMCRP